MGFIDHLISYFKKPRKEVEGTSPTGTCPLCWGYQEYDGKIRKLLKDKQIDVNNHRDAYMKVEKFIVQYINGIKLKKGKIESCPSCSGIMTNKDYEIMNNNQKKPIKRHEALKPLSRQHHFGLLFSWKIRQGFLKGISIDRLKSYADWFYLHEIHPHFLAEETYIFPILGNNHELIKRALKEHRRITRLFCDNQNPVKSLNSLEEELQAHIRFEERILFNEIQKTASQEELTRLENLHHESQNRLEYEDPFWEKE